jgi:hypothetical protein
LIYGNWMDVLISEAIEVTPLPMAMQGRRSELECNRWDTHYQAYRKIRRTILAGLLGR